jgi:tRNA nucleotidyltransferase (CCA-adding enzyme)
VSNFRSSELPQSYIIYQISVSEFDGSVYDYFYGYEDLPIFETSAESVKQILPSYLYYPDKHEPETLKIISKNVDGLERISGERIWVELKKILMGKFAGDSENRKI